MGGHSVPFTQRQRLGIKVPYPEPDKSPFAAFRQPRNFYSEPRSWARLASTTATSIAGPSQPMTQKSLSEWEKSFEQDHLHLKDLQAVFRDADKDSNGLVSQDELKLLLQDKSSGLHPVTVAWLSEAKVSNIMSCFQGDDRGGINFDEFASLARAGSMLNGKFTEYWRAFKGVDTSNNRAVGAAEIQQLFDQLGHPISETAVWKAFEKYDKDGTGQIGFPEFLDMFKDKLLDLGEILQYLELHPRPQAAEPESQEKIKLVEAQLGHVTLIFSEAELDSLLEEHSHRLTVLEASLTWCRPCKGFEKTLQRFAEMFPQTLFLKFYGNSNANCKHLIEERLTVPLTPTFTFFRNKADLGQTTGANKGRLFDKLTELLLQDENPLTEMSAFQQQVWRTKLGLG